MEERFLLDGGTGSKVGDIISNWICIGSATHLSTIDKNEFCKR
jgi:hypothetical protein